MSFNQECDDRFMKTAGCLMKFIFSLPSCSHMRARTHTLRKEGQGEEGGSWSSWVIAGEQNPTTPLFTPESSCPDSTPRPVVRRRSPAAECAPCGRRHVDIELSLHHCSKIFEISYFKTLRNSIIRGEQLSSPLQKMMASI